MENFSNGITTQLNRYLPTPDMLDYVLAILKEPDKLDQARTMQVEELREYVNRRYGGVARRRSFIPHKMEYSTRKLPRNPQQARDKTFFEPTLRIVHTSLPSTRASRARSSQYTSSSRSKTGPTSYLRLSSSSPMSMPTSYVSTLQSSAARMGNCQMSLLQQERSNLATLPPILPPLFYACGLPFITVIRDYPIIF